MIEQKAYKPNIAIKINLTITRILLTAVAEVSYSTHCKYVTGYIQESSPGSTRVWLLSLIYSTFNLIYKRTVVSSSYARKVSFDNTVTAEWGGRGWGAHSPSNIFRIIKS